MDYSEEKDGPVRGEVETDKYIARLEAERNAAIEREAILRKAAMAVRDRIRHDGQPWDDGCPSTCVACIFDYVLSTTGSRLSPHKCDEPDCQWNGYQALETGHVASILVKHRGAR